MVRLCQMTKIWVSNRIWPNTSLNILVDQGDTQANPVSVHRVQEVNSAKNDPNYDIDSLNNKIVNMEKEWKIVIERINKMELNHVIGRKIEKIAKHE